MCITAVWIVSLRTAAAADGCPDRGLDFFETQRYMVRTASVSGFWLLRRSVSSGAFAALEGKPFTEAALQGQARGLRDAIIRAPAAFDSLVAGTVVAPRVVNCREDGTARELDIEYRVFTTKVPLTSIRTWEFDDLERTHPGRALGLAPSKSRLRVTPVVGYDASQRLWGGGRLDSRVPGTRSQLQVLGQGSPESAVASGAMSGSVESDGGWLRQVTWRGAFEYANRPSLDLDLESGRGLGQVSVMSAPVGPFGALFRAGTLFEAGRQQTGLDQSTLPAGSLAESRFMNWRSYAGISLRTRRQSLAASYGFLLGRTGSGRLLDYRKQVFDAVYDTRVRAGTRWPFEVESRFTAGLLAHPGPTPVSERFFGGNVETPFVPGAEWAIRANPVLRGIPAYRLNRNTESGVPGADRFVAVNLTLAIPVYGVPLIPEEASQDPEIRQAVLGFVSDGADAMVPIHELNDPAQKGLFETRRDPLRKATAAIEERVAILEPSVPAALRPAYETCVEKAGDLAADAASITQSSPWRNFIKDDPEERGIPVIVQVCLVDLNGQLGDAQLTRLGNELKEQLKVIEQQVARIDTARARRRAEQDMQFPRVVMEALFDEMTIVSVSPMVILDVGRIGPGTAGQRSTRYSLGAGARFTLASSVRVDASYAWNLKPQPWEGPGALFVALQFIDLFGR